MSQNTMQRLVAVASGTGRILLGEFSHVPVPNDIVDVWFCQGGVCRLGIPVGLLLSSALRHVPHAIGLANDKRKRIDKSY